MVPCNPLRPRALANIRGQSCRAGYLQQVAWLGRCSATTSSGINSSSVWSRAVHGLNSPIVVSRRFSAPKQILISCPASSDSSWQEVHDDEHPDSSAKELQQQQQQQPAATGSSSEITESSSSREEDTSLEVQQQAHAQQQLVGLEASVPQQQQQQQQQQPQQRSPEQLQLQYLKHQALKLQALEDYQQLMTQNPSRKSSSTSRSDQGTETDDVPVLDAALLIAKHAHPDLDAQQVKQQLDDLAAEVEQALPAGIRYPLRVIKEINRVLYEVHGFKGNLEDYYHPDNSCINRVLETKQGIPISLSLVYMEVARRLGLNMAGVNLPAHFMIRPQVEGMEFMVDAFNGGELTALEDAEAVLGRLMGYQVKLDPRFVRGETPFFSGRQLLLRLLNNLRQIYMTLNIAEEALSIVRYMRATAPRGSLPELQRDEGMCLYGMGRLPEAAAVLTEYLRSGPSERGDTALVTAILDRIRKKAAEAAAAVAAATAAATSNSSRDEESASD